MSSYSRLFWRNVDAKSDDCDEMLDQTFESCNKSVCCIDYYLRVMSG